MKTLDLLKRMSDSIILKEHETLQLKNVLLNLIGGVSIIDLDGVYLEVNDKYANTCGYTVDELVGNEWVKTVFDEDIEIAKQCYYDMIDNGMSELMFRGVKKNGEVFNKEIILVSKYDINGNLNGHYCFMKEII
jgi:PAS domain S-box-containing protein